MKLRTKMSLVLAVSLLSFGMTGKVSAAVHVDHPEKFEITKEGHDEALEILKDQGVDLTNCPVPIKNLTTDTLPVEAVNPIPKAFSVANGNRMFYDIDGWDSSVPWAPNAGLWGDGYFNRYLVPVNYVPKDNAIPTSTVDSYVSGSYGKFAFNPGYVKDTGTGGYGDGGYYWRAITLYRIGNMNWNVTVWLSVWDSNNLIYG